MYTSNSKNCCTRRIRQFFIFFHFQCVACEECLIHRGFPVWAASLLQGVLPPAPRFTFTLAISGHWLPPQTLALPVESKQAMWALWPQEILAFFVRPFQSLPIQLHYNVFEASVTTGFFIFTLASSVATILISPDPVRMQVWTSNKFCQISRSTSVQWSVGIQFSCSVNLSLGSPLPKAVSLLSTPTIYPQCPWDD